MSKNDKKLELNWANKNKSLYYDVDTGNYEWVDKKDPRVTEPRIFLQKETYGDKNTENILVKGDNLLALQSLLQDFRSKIKLIFIDPPYNTGNAFSHYDDGMEHSLWLGLMKTRLEALHRLLSRDGTIWISIDDDESHYLKVLCDEVFGRKNFVSNVIWEKKYSPQNDAKWLSDSHDHILVYAKNKDVWRPKLLSRTEEMNARYKNPDNDPRGVWKSADLTAKDPFPYGIYEITSPSGKKFLPSNNRHWVYGKDKMEGMIKDNRIWFGKSGGNKPSLKIFLSEVKQGTVAKTIWFRTEVGDNQEAKREIRAFNKDDEFTTPKPERLINRIVDLASEEGDWVLDSFAGSGTTGAVAHKRNRKWIMVELGNHAKTHIIPRLKSVVLGKDQGGISKLVDWKGGGGFKYFELGDSLFVADDDLRLTILNPKVYNGALIRAVLKVEGFRLLHPDNALHGVSGKTIAHVTEQYLSQEYVNALLREVGDAADYLIIYAKTISSKIKLPENVEIRKIPDVLLKKFKV
jgi:adenine-specific DNA-methyltransferase